ncbi:MAG: hypothetical protein JW846_01390 [Dehalococcoidia bacterium]|nr:hypothetical protein [Dehalococcoidia bacterium]
MKVHVLVRHAPDPGTSVRVTKDGVVDWGGMPPVPNPSDLSAVETAVRLKEEGMASFVTAVSAGNSLLDATLHLAVAMGVDDALRIPADSVNWMSPRNLALGLVQSLKDGQSDLFLCGQTAPNDESAQVAYQLAALLGWPVVTAIVTLKASAERLVVTRRLDKGVRETLELPLPAVVAVHESIADARYVGRGARARASRAAVNLGSQDVSEAGGGLSNDLGLPTPVFGRPMPAAVFVPDSELPALERLEQVISGGVSEKAGSLMRGTPCEVAARIADFIDARFGQAHRV